MTLTFTVQIERLRREAKRLARQESIPLHKALDRQARRHGYRNWSLLAAASRRQTPSLPLSPLLPQPAATTPTLDASLVSRFSAHRRPVAVVDGSGTLMFGNQGWKSLMKRCGVTVPYGIGADFGHALPIDTTLPAGFYAKAVVDEAMARLLADQMTVFIQACSLKIGLDAITYSLLFTQCQFEDGEKGAVIWLERPKGKGKAVASFATRS